MFSSPFLRSRIRSLAAGVAIVVLPLGVVFATATAAQAAPPPRPQGPCDVYAAAGTPCVAAHSTTRALYASYSGPLYQVMRLSDTKVKDIGVVQPVGLPFPDAGGYADAAAQDVFCADTTCLITKVYDQSPMHNDLTQAPRGAFSGPALGGFNNLPVADMAPVTISGHKAYGVFIEPGMGLRNDDTRGIAVDDQPEGMYWVLNGRHFNDGCCFDYGNAEIDSRDDGNGTMETSYFGNATAWYHGPPPGPWIMTDQENNLVGCVNPGSTSKLCAELPSITDRFVTAVAKGEPHHWASLGGNAQQGALSTMFDGPRVDSSYDPMRKQGAIVLGNGGDNSNASQGTFYEGVMTAGYPSDATDNAVQANVVAAKYDVQRLSLAPASATATPPGLQTFAPGSSQDVTETFTNTTGSRAAGVRLSVSVPDKAWTSFVAGTTDRSMTFDSVAPGASVSATFSVTSGPAAFNGDLVGNASWTNPTEGARQSETTTEKVRNISPIKINEFRTGTSGNSTNSFIELYNAGASAVDISNWTLTEHPSQQAIFSTITVPAGTTLAGHGHYLLALANSGLAAPAKPGDTTLYVRSTAGMAPGQQVQVGSGSTAETRTITSVGAAASGNTTLWQPLPDGPVMTIPAGSTNVPVTSTSGFTVGQKMAIGYGARYEQATVTAVGKPGTQARLSAAAAAGGTNIKATSTANITAGDTIRLDIGPKIETVTVAAVGTSGAGGTGLDLTAPLKFDHASNLPFSDRGTGVSFTPATTFAHSSNEPVQALAGAVTYTYDDTDPVLQYSGTWSHVANQSFTGGDYMNTESFSNQAGDSLTVPFNGTAIRWIGSRTSNHGFADVYVDGTKQATVDASGSQNQAVLFSQSGLADGAHTLKIVVDGAHSSGSTDNFVAIDAIDVPTGSVPTSGVTLDSPLADSHAINAPLRDANVTTAGYQGTPAPDQWFGGPALSSGSGTMVLRDAQGRAADSLNYGSLVDPSAAEGYQGGTGSGCTVAAPGSGSGAGRSASRFPDGNDTDTNCADFITSGNPTPGAANVFTLDPGPLVSVHGTTPGSSSDYIKHDDTDDLVITTPITASSSQTDKQDATWVETAGLANPSCVSFEAINRPGSYLRHQNFQFHLQPNDGSTLFSQDATFCPGPGNNGQGTSFQSVNFSGRYIRVFNSVVYLASNGPPGTNPWDTSTGWADDTSWVVANPWAQPPGSPGGGN